MRIKVDINIKNLNINRIIKFFLISDLFLLGGWGLISPIFAIFLTQKIPGVNLFIVGSVASVYLITKSLVQVPVAVALDRHEGEKDDFYTLVLGTTMAGFTAIAFLLVHDIFTVYLVAFLQGLSFALYAPSWSAIFSRHLDKDHYAFDWSLDSTTIGLSSGIAAFVGGAAAKVFGFEVVFILASIMSFASAFLLLMVPNLVLPKATLRIPSFKSPFFKESSPVNIEIQK